MNENIPSPSEPSAPPPSEPRLIKKLEKLKKIPNQILKTAQAGIQRVSAMIKKKPINTESTLLESKEQESLFAQFKNFFTKESLRNIARQLEPMTLAERFSEYFQKQGAIFWGKTLTILLCAFFLADLSALLIDYFVPDPPPVRLLRSNGMQKKNKTLEEYGPIFSRNLFNSQGLIPGEESSGPKSTGADLTSPPIKTTLPLNLIGTLILRDELRSIATIEDKSSSTVYPVRINDEIPSKAKILKVEPRKVIFLNVASNRREYVDLPEDINPLNPRITLATPQKAKGPVVEQVAPTQYNIPRTEVDKALSNLNEILTQARCIPNFENGLPSGYKCFQIVPGSIYDKLGLQNNDTIMGINGESISDPGQAFQKLAELKTASHYEINIKRDGKTMTLTYDIH